MTFSSTDIRANYEYFAHKLRAEKQRNDVLKAVEANTFDFVLLDTRGREAFANGTRPRRLVRSGVRNRKGCSGPAKR
jgi:hypothetical protein